MWVCFFVIHLSFANAIIFWGGLQDIMISFFFNIYEVHLFRKPIFQGKSELNIQCFQTHPNKPSKRFQT